MGLVIDYYVVQTLSAGITDSRNCRVSFQQIQQMHNYCPFVFTETLKCCMFYPMKAADLLADTKMFGFFPVPFNIYSMDSGICEASKAPFLKLIPYSR